jgi:predicted amidohydrolase
MKVILFIFGFLLSSVLMCTRAWAGDKQKTRSVTLSALCLLDDSTKWNQAYVLGEIRAAAERQPQDLVVAPITPFLSFREGEELEDLAEFADLARTHKMYLAVAMMEAALDGRTFCTSVLLDRKGEMVGKYRKTHGLPDDEMALGNDLAVFKTDFGVLGFSLGTDFYFPEVYAVERMKGAEILVWQHFPERFREHFQWLPLLKARALDSHAFMVTAMYSDPKTYITNRYEMGMQGAAWGRSMVINRVGTPIADTGHSNGIATAIVDLARRKQDPYDTFYEAEDIFFVNNLGDRTAFKPLTEPWTKPEIPAFTKRKARIVVGYFGGQNMWKKGRVPETMLRILCIRISFCCQRWVQGSTMRQPRKFVQWSQNGHAE